MTLDQRLSLYPEFAAANSPGGSYLPGLAAASLVSLITPEGKGITVAAMTPGESYNERGLYHRVGEYCREIGEFLPISFRCVWNYVEIIRTGQRVPGLLTRGGITVKTNQGYKVTDARELVLPIMHGAARFVSAARGRADYVSAGSIFGKNSGHARHSNISIVLGLIKYLASEPGKHGISEILDKTGIDPSSANLSLTLQNLGKAKVIAYDSRALEIDGERPRDWAEYRPADFPDRAEAREMVYKAKPTFNEWSLLFKVLDYAAEHPHAVVTSHFLERRIGGSYKNISKVLAALWSAEIFDKEYGPPESADSSAAEANPVTHMLYENVVGPALNTAMTLKPAGIRAGSRELREYIRNYSEESTTARDRPDTKKAVLRILEESGRIKLSAASELLKKATGRNYRSDTCQKALRRLIGEGKARSLGNGWYASTSSAS